MGILYLVATPLGNLEDITLRALRILRAVSLIATEDTRTTGKLLKHFEISCPMLSYHDHSNAAQQTRVLEALQAGDVALVSEAGMPLISDPGHGLVQAALAEGAEVVAVPGASALTAALPVSGLPINQFMFLGFPPRKAGQRRQFLQAVKRQPTTLVLFESPHRVRATMAALADVLGAERQVAVCRELTKLHEEIWRGTLAEAVAEWQTRPPRGEFTLVVAGAPESPSWSPAEVSQALREAINSGLSTRDAVQQVTTLSGWRKRAVYALAQKIS